MQYRRSSSHLAGPPIAAYGQYQPTQQYSTPQVPQYSGFTAQYHGQNFPSYQSQQQGQQQSSFTAVPSQSHQYTPTVSTAERDTNDINNPDIGVPHSASF
jgi:hypothetical protein